MISQIEYPGASSVIVSIALWGLLFILSLLLPIKRKELGFRILPVATGLWFFSSLVPLINPLIDSGILNQVNYYAPSMGCAAAVVAVAVLLAHKGGARTLVKKIKQPNTSWDATGDNVSR